MLKTFSLFNGLATWFEGVTGDIINYVGNFFMTALSIIPKVMYLFATFLLTLLDFVQVLFKKLAGLDIYYVETGSTTVPQTGDMVEFIIREVVVGKGALNNAFWGLIIIGAVLFFIATFVAVIRSVYAYEESKASGTLLKKSLGGALKTLVSFIAVPVFCMVGIFIANAILVAIDQATQPATANLTVSDRNYLEPYKLSTGKQTYFAYGAFSIGDTSVGIASTSMPFSGMVFKASAYRANRIRVEESFKGCFTQADNPNYSTVNFGLFYSEYSEISASKVDDAFAATYRLKQSRELDLTATPEIETRTWAATTGILALDFSIADILVPVKTFSKFRVGLVNYYYDLWKFDFVVAYGSLVTMLVIFMNIIFALIKRIFELTILFLIAPGIIGITPLDDGEAFKRWRKAFIEKTISIYGAVAGMNIFYLILAELNKIRFFQPVNVTTHSTTLNVFEYLTQALIAIVGLAAVKDLIATLSKVIGSEDLNKAGEEMSKSVTDTALRTGSMMSIGARMATKTMTAPARGAMGAARTIFPNSRVLGRGDEGTPPGGTPPGGTPPGGTPPGETPPGEDDVLDVDLGYDADARARASSGAGGPGGGTGGGTGGGPATGATAMGTPVTGAPAGGPAPTGGTGGGPSGGTGGGSGGETSPGETPPSSRPTGRDRLSKFGKSLKNTAREIWMNMSGDAEWGYLKMDERDDKGVGPKSVFGKTSNFAGKNFKDRKFETRVNEANKARQAQVEIYQKSIDSLVKDLHIQPNDPRFNDPNFQNEVMRQYAEHTGEPPTREKADVILQSIRRKLTPPSP